MDRDRLVTLRLPESLLLALGRTARLRGMAAADLVRAILAEGAGQTAGVLPDRPLRAPLAEEFASATDWVDLQSRLRRRGFALRCSADGGLALHDWPGDRHLVPLSRLGQDEAALTLRFRGPFPGRVIPTATAAGRAA
jgi:hypothetical protein